MSTLLLCINLISNRDSYIIKCIDMVVKSFVEVDTDAKAVHEDGGGIAKRNRPWQKSSAMVAVFETAATTTFLAEISQRRRGLL